MGINIYDLLRRADLTEAERAFVTAFEAYARESVVPFDIDLDCFRQDSALVIYLDGELLTPGIHLVGNRLRADRLHNQVYSLPDEPTSSALDVTGTPTELARQAVAWFDKLLQRPIERWEWVYDGGVYAYLYVFADTGEGLVAMHNELFGPGGSGPLGPPDRIVRLGG